MPEYFHVAYVTKAGRTKRHMIPFSAADDLAAWSVCPPGEDAGEIASGGGWKIAPTQAFVSRGGSASWEPPVRKDTMQPIEGA